MPISSITPAVTMTTMMYYHPPPQLPPPPQPPSPFYLALFHELSQNTAEVTKQKADIELLKDMGLLKEKLVMTDK